MTIVSEATKRVVALYSQLTTDERLEVVKALGEVPKAEQTVKITVGHLRAVSKDLPDDAEVIVWVGDDDDNSTAVNSSYVTSFGPHGLEDHAADDSLHIYVNIL